MAGVLTADFWLTALSPSHPQSPLQKSLRRQQGQTWRLILPRACFTAVVQVRKKAAAAAA